MIDRGLRPFYGQCPMGIDVCPILSCVFFCEDACCIKKSFNFAPGEMAERSNAAVLKTVVGNTTGGSNPSLSAFACRSGLRRTRSASSSRRGLRSMKRDIKPVINMIGFFFLSMLVVHQINFIPTKIKDRNTLSFRKNILKFPN